VLLSYLVKKIEKVDSEILAEWLSSDNWPFFLGHNQTKSQILKRIEDGDFFGDGELNFWIIDSENNLIGLTYFDILIKKIKK
jgi:hypothetical protein